MFIGSHVSMKDPNNFLGSIEETLSYKANALMIYTGAPQNTRRKDINLLKIDEALALMKEHNLDTNHIVVHAPYVMNLANPSLEKREFAVEFLTSEIERSHRMHATQIVLHPGSAVASTVEQGISWIAEGLNQVIENTKDKPVRIALETMAGKGNEIGRTFEELKQIIEGVHLADKIGVCLDTCHVYDAGYDIVNNLDGVLDEFDKIIGLNRLYAIHLNDSKNPFSSKKDRHETIGNGQIGIDAIDRIINHPKLRNLPFILETPNELDGHEREIKLLKGLVPKAWCQAP